MICLCGNPALQQRGFTLGGSFSQVNYRCTNCRRSLMQLSVAEQKATVIFDDSLNHLVSDWCNNALIVWMRASKESESVLPVPEVLPGLSVVIDTQVYDYPATVGHPIPTDPLRTRHDKFWREFFTEMKIDNYQEINNRYSGDPNQPWYRIPLSASEIIVGPRFRVYALSLISGKRFVDADKLAAIAKCDNVTFSVDRYIVNIHAWSREKLVEYFTVLLEMNEQVHNETHV